MATPEPDRWSRELELLVKAALNSIRFGLMTIDSDTLPNTGVTASDGTNLTFNDVANGGTTTVSSPVSINLVTPLKPGSCAVPFFGVVPKVLDERGKPIAGARVEAVDLVLLGRDEQRAVVQQRLRVDLSLDHNRKEFAESLRL